MAHDTDKNLAAPEDGKAGAEPRPTAPPKHLGARPSEAVVSTAGEPITGGDARAPRETDAAPRAKASTAGGVADTAVGPTVRCFVLQTFCHNSSTYQPGEWLELPDDWAKLYAKSRHVTDCEGYYARNTSPGGKK